MVLRLTDQGDRNRILTLFTVAHGRTSVAVARARGPSKRFQGKLDLFYRGVAFLARPKRANGLYRLTEFQVTEPYEALRNDLVRFASASFFIDLVLSSTAVGDASRKQFEVLASLLDQLQASEESVRRDLILSFQLQWFQTMGVLPTLDTESLRHAGLPPLDGQALAIARGLLANVPIPELDLERFQAVGVLTRHLRNRTIGRPLASTSFLHQMLSDAEHTPD
jgi:DNA repair protein RecO (recombination protein O)